MQSGNDLTSLSPDDPFPGRWQEWHESYYRSARGPSLSSLQSSSYAFSCHFWVVPWHGGMKVRGRKSEVGSRRSEVGGQKSEVRSQRPGNGGERWRFGALDCRELGTAVTRL